MLPGTLVSILNEDFKISTACDQLPALLYFNHEYIDRNMPLECFETTWDPRPHGAVERTRIRKSIELYYQNACMWPNRNGYGFFLRQSPDRILGMYTGRWFPNPDFPTRVSTDRIIELLGSEALFWLPIRSY